MDIRKKELYEVFADSLVKSRTKEGGLLFDKLFEDIWEHIEPKLGQSLPIYGVSQQRELLNALADNFNESTHTYVGQPMIEETLKAFNCG